MDERIRGRESAQGLKYLLRKSSIGTRELADLVKKIFNSHANSSGGGGGDNSVEVSENLRIKSEDSESGNSLKSSRRKEGRGCYKRRKCLESWSKESCSDLIDDGYVWRKYGQKAILDANHPRSYFRCTHKHEQNCQARKYTQQIQDNPPKFLTTYYDQHTCTNFLRSSDDDDDLFSDTAAMNSSSSGSVLLSFGSSATTAAANIFKQDSIFYSSSSSVKQEMTVPSHGHSMSTTTSDPYLVSPDITSGSSMFDDGDDDFFARVYFPTYQFDDDVLQDFEL